MASRLKREELARTKHDRAFSKWQILIGPSDWDDYLLGKDGIEKYRIHNLPIESSCPGLYELGIALVPTNGPRSHKHDSENIIVVYLGQADNVRTRLQQYGRGGAHLDHGSSTASLENEKPTLFKETFSSGYSILFRWAPMKNKIEAEKTEADLLDVFDYAWNRRANGACRANDIFRKLDSKATSPIHTQPWSRVAFAKEAGIKIDAGSPLDDQKGFLLPKILKFGKSQFRFIPGDDCLNGDHDICGVAIGDGTICRSRPVVGGKRCEEHKGKKITSSSSVGSSGIITTQAKTTACGVFLEDGSLCMELPDHGRTRCELHKGSRVTNSKLHVKPDTGLSDQMENQVSKCQPRLVPGMVKHPEEYDICGVVYSDGSVCRNKPISGRKRCEQHKGQRIVGPKLLTSREGCETKGTYKLDEEVTDICGVVSDDGSVCRRQPRGGRKRCEEHKGRRITGPMLISLESSRVIGDFSICGVALENGSICRNSPAPGRKRCQVHKGRRVT